MTGEDLTQFPGKGTFHMANRKSRDLLVTAAVAALVVVAMHKSGALQKLKV